MTLNNPPMAQYVVADDLPLPELPSVISTTTGSAGAAGMDEDDGENASSNELPLQYSIEEEDGGNSLISSATTATLSNDSTGLDSSC